jgi:hypothetical protein
VKARDEDKSRDDHRVQSLLAKSGRKACPSSQRRNINKSGHKTSIKETCTSYEALKSRDGGQKGDAGCGKHGREQDPALSPFTKSGRKPVLPTSPATRP